MDPSSSGTQSPGQLNENELQMSETKQEKEDCNKKAIDNSQLKEEKNKLTDSPLEPSTKIDVKDKPFGQTDKDVQISDDPQESDGQLSQAELSGDQLFSTVTDENEKPGVADNKTINEQRVEENSDTSSWTNVNKMYEENKADDMTDKLKIISYEKDTTNDKTDKKLDANYSVITAKNSTTENHGQTDKTNDENGGEGNSEMSSSTKLNKADDMTDKREANAETDLNKTEQEHPDPTQAKSLLITPLKEKEKMKQDCTAEVGTDEGYIIVITAITVVAAILIPLLLSSNIKKSINVLEQIDNELNSLQENFPAQKLSFRVLRAAIKGVTKSPKQPAVVVFLAPSGTEQITSCFVQNLAHSIEDAFGSKRKFIHLVGKQLIGDAGNIKKHLESEAYEGFKNGGNVYLLENLNVIPIESAMMFHGLCDDNYAPFKKVVYLFTANIVDYDGVTGLSEKDLKTFKVTTGWSESVNEDELSSLESRIGMFKVLIKPEKNWESLREKLNC